MNLLKPILIVLILIIIFDNKEVCAQYHRFVIPVNVPYLDASVSPYNQIKPGDTVFFLGGSKQYLMIKNFKGSPRLPIIFSNLNGTVNINTNWYFGMTIANCQYIRFTGTGDTRFFYGFMISGVQGGAGLGVGYLSSDVEVDHCYFANTLIAGIYSKTDPDCTLKSLRSNFTQYNTVIHDNYLLNTGDEGMYIGSSFYLGETINCNGKDTVVMPHVLKGVRIYNNIVKYSGYDGIQVASAVSDCLIFNNLIMYDSQAAVYAQMSGFLLGGGSKCDCYNNYIYKGKGDGIDCLGLGGNKLYNNVIVSPGYNYYPGNMSYPKHGIYVGDNTVVPGNSFTILFNDIINPKTDGIYFNSSLSANNPIYSNVIVNPGGGTSRYIQTVTNNTIQKNNFLTMDITTCRFADTTYALTSTSPLIDAGYTDNKGIYYDYFYHPRPYGHGYDIGINEYNPLYPPLIDAPLENIEPSDSTHPIEKNQSLRIDRLPYPDPASTKVAIDYFIDSINNVILDVYNSDGNQIYHYEENRMPPGSHTIDLDVTAFPDGVCLFTIRAGREIISGRFIKVRS